MEKGKARLLDFPPLPPKNPTDFAKQQSTQPQEVIETDQSQIRQEDTNDSRVSWVYELCKTDLQRELEKRNLDTVGSVKELRARLILAVRMPASTLFGDIATGNSAQLPSQTGGIFEEDNALVSETQKQSLELQKLLEIVGLSPNADMRHLKQRLTDLTNNEKVRSREMFLDGEPSRQIDDQELLQPPLRTQLPLRTNHLAYPNLQFENDKSSAFPTAALCNLVRKWNLRFEERSDPISFIERLNELIEAYEIPANQILKALPEIFKGYSLLWWRNNRDSWRNFDEFRRAFELQYFPPGYYRNLDREIQERTQGEREPCRQYVVAISTLIRRRGGFNSQTQIDRIYNNLKPEYRFYIRRVDVTSMAQLLNRAEEYEALLRDRSNYRPPPGPAQSLTPDTAYQPKNRSRVGFHDSVHLEELHPVQTSNRETQMSYRKNMKPSDHWIKTERCSRSLSPGYISLSRPNIDVKQPDLGRRERRNEKIYQVISKPNPRSSAPSYAPVVCWNCDSEGHMFRECRKPRKLKCFHCKTVGRRTTSCPYQSGNGFPVLRKGSR